MRVIPSPENSGNILSFIRLGHNGIVITSRLYPHYIIQFTSVMPCHKELKHIGRQLLLIIVV